MVEDGLTEQQRKWMASVRASLPEKTGKSMDAWVEVARTCPETKPRARLAWFKQHHGLGQNYAGMIEHEMRTRDGAEDPRDPQTLGAALWSDPASAEVFRAVEAAVAELPEVIVGQRKGYTTFSRRFAFAAARPVKGGAVRLGLAVAAGDDGPPAASDKEGWSERLTSTYVLADREQVDDAVRHALRAAWERS